MVFFLKYICIEKNPECYKLKYLKRIYLEGVIRGYIYYSPYNFACFTNGITR